MPALVSGAYRELVERHSLQNLARARDSPVGGLSSEETDKHFAQAFDGSVARLELALLDPKGHLGQWSDFLINNFSGETVLLTDAPCGAGAASFSLLSTIAALRSEAVLPRQPLHIIMLGAELSRPARDYAEEFLRLIDSGLREQAIFVRMSVLEWDATDQVSNTDLVIRMTEERVWSSRTLLVVANFSGFLEQHGKKKAAEPQLNELFRHASRRDSKVLWVEPQMTKVEKGVLQWVLKRMKQGWKKFVRLQSSEGEPYRSDAIFERPLAEGTRAKVRLLVLPIELYR